eukprot:c28909_g1_i1 orf=382-729(+)
MWVSTPIGIGEAKECADLLSKQDCRNDFSRDFIVNNIKSSLWMTDTEDDWSIFHFSWPNRDTVENLRGEYIGWAKICPSWRLVSLHIVLRQHHEIARKRESALVCDFVEVVNSKR